MLPGAVVRSGFLKARTNSAEGAQDAAAFGGVVVVSEDSLAENSRVAAAVWVSEQLGRTAAAVA